MCFNGSVRLKSGRGGYVSARDMSAWRMARNGGNTGMIGEWSMYARNNWWMIYVAVCCAVAFVVGYVARVGGCYT